MPVTTSDKVHPIYSAPLGNFQPGIGLNGLEAAIVQAATYADVFDYPLTPQEVHRYLVGVSTSLAAVQAALDSDRLIPRYLVRHQGYAMLQGREHIVATRCRRAGIAARTWPRAIRYGYTIGHLPFVRMVAVTGAQCMANAEAGSDIDYLIVTEPERLWLCRAVIIALVRRAARCGDSLCPNYLLSERALLLDERNLFTAHEFLQMVPIVGLETYRRMWQLNTWTAEFLPNAYAQAQNVLADPLAPHPVRSLLEAPLRTPIGAWLEQWEMTRKISKLARRDNSHGDRSEVAFSADCCKGHFDDYAQRTLVAFSARLREVADA